LRVSTLHLCEEGASYAGTRSTPGSGAFVRIRVRLEWLVVLDELVVNLLP
jgi:hypothetical protein